MLASKKPALREDATVMDTQDLVKSLGGTLIVPVTMRGKYRGTAVSSVLNKASSRRSLYVTTRATVAALELMEIHQSAKVLEANVTVRQM